MRHEAIDSLVEQGLGFSPVAGIQWVETDDRVAINVKQGFSPVAGIQWVETPVGFLHKRPKCRCFSPVAGIQWVETSYKRGGRSASLLFQSRCRDSVG